jgi:cell division protein FtsB
MKNFQQRRKLRQVMQSGPVLVLLGVVIVVFAWSVIGLFNKMRETADNKKSDEAEIQVLQKEKEDLLSNINKLKTNEGVEEVIRDRYGLAKDGESMIVVTDDQNSTQTATENKTTSFLSFFNNWFK